MLGRTGMAGLGAGKKGSRQDGGGRAEGQMCPGREGFPGSLDPPACWTISKTAPGLGPDTSYRPTRRWQAQRVCVHFPHQLTKHSCQKPGL